MIRRVAGMADHLAVMYAAGGRARAGERGFYRPRHPYTRGLLAATPRMRARWSAAANRGSPPSLARRPGGCAFPSALPAGGRAALRDRGASPAEVDGAYAACHYAEARPSPLRIDPDRGEAHAG